MIKDIASDLNVSRLSALAISTNTTTYSASVDTKDSDMGLFLAVLATAWTDGSYVVTLQDSPNDSTWADLDAGQYNGGSTSLTIGAATAAGASMGKLGAHSNDRYLRAKVVSTGASTGAALSVLCVKTGEVMPI